MACESVAGVCDTCESGGISLLDPPIGGHFVKGQAQQQQHFTRLTHQIDATQTPVGVFVQAKEVVESAVYAHEERFMSYIIVAVCVFLYPMPCRTKPL